MHNNELPNIVKDAVNGPFQRLNFYTPPMDAQLTKACVLAAGSNNGFTPYVVNLMIDEIAALDSNVLFVLGRESSMVLYVHQSIVPVQRLMNLLRMAQPDELDRVHAAPYASPTAPLVRAWWD